MSFLVYERAMGRGFVVNPNTQHAHPLDAALVAACTSKESAIAVVRLLGGGHITWYDDADTYEPSLTDIIEEPNTQPQAGRVPFANETRGLSLGEAWHEIIKLRQRVDALEGKPKRIVLEPYR